MSKYWLMLVVCGAVACSAATPLDQAGENQEAVSDADTGKGAQEPSTGSKKDGDKDDSKPKPGEACDKDRNALIEALAAAKDPAVITALKQKYIELDKRCPAGPDPTQDDCKLQLAEAEKYLAIAIKSGDDKAIAEAKEKYAATEKQCHAGDIVPCKEPGAKPDDKPANGSDGGKPCDKPNDGGKPGDKPEVARGKDGGLPAVK